jgi:hypothetical protein
MCVGPRGDVCVMCVCVVEMELDGAIGAINGTKVEPFQTHHTSTTSIESTKSTLNL